MRRPPDERPATQERTERGKRSVQASKTPLPFTRTAFALFRDAGADSATGCLLASSSGTTFTALLHGFCRVSCETPACVHVEMESAIAKAAQHRFGVHVRDRRTSQRQTVGGQSRRELSRRQTTDVHCFFTRTAIALLYTACIAESSGSIARMAFRQ